ncbi:putative GDP-6-deoxy-D-lyxo-4-hexulose reductase [Hyphomonas hirschiana VP5]|uniref:Putative GDP-6-deoxy-D-lyxo-4-hexulose reductase n=1 Tax=Hyphomonas hirschiana VP5 TaxID=1280951 RepID=A0A059G0J6_9PROT|nr:putative GDP-6-deoxy-D-lyxo-4-hexulose reductase [Hyphomonas hirschiana VP5]
MHLAAIALPSQAKADPSAAWAVNFEAVRQLGEAVLACSPHAVLVFAGSSESYGASFNTVAGAVNEGTALRPLTPYAATKAAADVALGQMRNDGLNAVRFRAFNHTGPGQSPDYVVASFAAQIAQIIAGDHPPVIRVGNLDAMRDFVDVRDVVRGYRLALETELDPVSEGVFNLASGTPRSIRSILNTLIDIAGVDIAIETDPAKLRKNDVPRTWGDANRARTELGWVPYLAFEQTLVDTLSSAGAKISGCT